MEAKNHDYTGASGTDPLANFKTVELVGLGDAAEFLLARKLDKMKRMITYLKAGELKVADETIIDAVLDDINYDILFLGLLLDKGKIKEV